MLLLTLLITVATHAQWKQTNGPCGGWISSIYAKDSTLFAGTQSGIFRSTSFGKSWGLLYYTFDKVNCFASDGEKIFAGTEHGDLIIISGNDNHRERIITNDYPQGYEGSIWSIAISGNTIFIGTSYSLFVSTDYGQKWTELKNAPRMVRSLIIRESIVLACSLFDSYLYRSTDLGLTWKKVRSVSNIIISNNILILSADGIYRSDDFGSTWTKTADQIGGVLVKCKNEISCLGWQGIYRSSDNGLTWNNRMEWPPQFAVNELITIASSGTKLFAGTYEDIYISEDYGQSWIASTEGLTSTQIHWMTTQGNRLLALTYEGITYFSENCGISWEKIHKSSQGGGYLRALHFCGNNIITPGIGGMDLSSDNGQSWEKVLDGGYCFANMDDKVFAGTSQGLVVSTDYGKTWSTTGLTRNSVNQLTSVEHIAIIGSNIFAYYSSYYSSDVHGVLISTDEGKSWSQVNLSVSNAIDNPPVRGFVVNENDLFAWTSGNGLVRSSDLGKSWTSVWSGFQDMSIVSQAIKDSTLFAVVDSSLGPSAKHLGVFVSKDYGKTWKPINEGLPDFNVATIAVEGNDLYAGTAFGGVWKRSIAEIITDIGKKEEVVPSNFSLSQNYPNPFNPTTTIKYQLPITGHVTLKVYDLLGREVATLVNEEKTPGNYQVKFDGSNLSSGVYFYRMQAGDFTQTKKIVLLK